MAFRTDTAKGFILKVSFVCILRLVGQFYVTSTQMQINGPHGAERLPYVHLWVFFSKTLRRRSSQAGQKSIRAKRGEISRLLAA